MISPPSSPPPALHGSSRTTGGSTRGHATGNVFNFADAGDDDNLETPVLRTGKVHIYNSPVNPIEVKPFRVLKVDVQFFYGHLSSNLLLENGLLLKVWDFDLLDLLFIIIS